MRSIVLAVVLFAGILACSNAAPQLNLGWLEAILREAGQRNSTVRFGNGTVIVSGVANAVASTNDAAIQPRPPSNQWSSPPWNQWNSQPWNPWNNNRYPYSNGGFWRISPGADGQIVEEPVSSSEESQEVPDDISDERSEEVVYHLEDQTVEDEEDEEMDEAEHEEEEGSQETEQAVEVEDEEIDLEEEAADAELDVMEKELAAKETN